MTISSTFDLAGAKKDLAKRVQKAQKVLDDRVITDSNYFCPQDTGTLMRSARLSTKLGSGLVMWKTPYADKRYYGDPETGSSRNPNATNRWFESAKAVHCKEWVEKVNGVIKAD